MEQWPGDGAAAFHKTGSNEQMCNTGPSNGKVRIGSAAFIKVECVGTVTIVLPSETEDVTLRLEGVAHVPELKFNLFSLAAADQRRLSFKPVKHEVTSSLLDGGLEFPFDWVSCCKLRYRIACIDAFSHSEVLPMM